MPSSSHPPSTDPARRRRALSALEEAERRLLRLLELGNRHGLPATALWRAAKRQLKGAGRARRGQVDVIEARVSDLERVSEALVGEIEARRAKAAREVGLTRPLPSPVAKHRPHRSGRGGGATPEPEGGPIP